MPLSDEDVERHSDVVGLERANLVLVLLVAQAIQVLLLSLAVWVFFIVFGAVAIDERRDHVVDRRRPALPLASTWSAGS